MEVERPVEKFKDRQSCELAESGVVEDTSTSSRDASNGSAWSIAGVQARGLATQTPNFFGARWSNTGAGKSPMRGPSKSALALFEQPEAATTMRCIWSEDASGHSGNSWTSWTAKEKPRWTNSTCFGLLSLRYRTEHT